MAQRIDNHGLVIGGQLRKAREILGFSLEEVATLLGVTAAEIIAWEEDRASPELQQLERLAGIYGREVDYFLQETPDSLVQYKFRSGTGKSFTHISREARLVISKFEELCRKGAEIERLLGMERVISVATASTGETPGQVAVRQRKVLGFDGKPVSGVKERFYAIGIRVFELPVPSLEFSGLSNWDLEYGPRILLNAKELQGRRNFTLAHEFAHLLYRHGASVCEIPEEGRSDLSLDERYADRFAVEFLLPGEPLRRDFDRFGFSRRPSIQEVGKLAGRWQASVQATLYRLEDLGLIESGYAGEVLGTIGQYRIRRRATKTPSWERRLGQEFVANALSAYKAGHISIGKLANCLGLPLRKTVEVVERRVSKE